MCNWNIYYVLISFEFQHLRYNKAMPSIFWQHPYPVGNAHHLYAKRAPNLTGECLVSVKSNTIYDVLLKSAVAFEDSPVRPRKRPLITTSVLVKIPQRRFLTKNWTFSDATLCWRRSRLFLKQIGSVIDETVFFRSFIFNYIIMRKRSAFNTPHIQDFSEKWKSRPFTMW